MDSPAQPRTVAEHARRAVALVEPLPVVDVPLDDAVGTVLARDLVALLDLPPFDAAAMDGYALRRSDATEAVTLTVVADVPAGSCFDGVVGPGEAVRIMTGAPLPAGADVVVPVERTSTGAFAPGDHGGRPGTGAGTDTSDADVVAVPALTAHDRAHVRLHGEDVTAGTVVAPAGVPVSARLAALADALGHATLPVRRAPVVAVLSTGDELVPAGEPIGPGQIPDSNSVLLAGAVREVGARARRRGGVADSPEALAAALDDAADAGADLIVTTGGVSVGAYDVVRALLPPGGATHPGGAARPGPATDAEVVSVGMAPGRPQGLARWRGIPWVAAPGNPTGAYASFELFVRPMIDRLRGLDEGARPGASAARATASTSWSSPPGRVQLVPVRALPDGSVAPTGDGHRLSSLAGADGLALVPADVEEVRPGDTAEVRWFAGAAPNVTPDDAPFDAIVLAGGRAERLGTPKPGLTVGAATLLEHALAATIGARRVAVVGPDDLVPAVGGRGRVTREDPAFGGPVAGIAAGLAALGPGRAPRVLVLACDVPRASAAMPALLDAASGDPSSPDGAFLVRDGRAQWLVGVYARSALDTALADLARARPDGLHGASVRSLMAGLRCVEVPDPDGLSDDVDTWADATRLAAVSRAPTPPPPPRRNR